MECLGIGFVKLLVICLHGVGKAHQHAIPVFGFRKAEFLPHLAKLAEVSGDHRLVDLHGGFGPDGFGCGREFYFSPLEIRAYEIAFLHFAFAQRGRHAHYQVELFAVERLDFHCNFLGERGGCAAAKAGHG